MVVQHNMPALTANRYYTTNNSSLSKSLEKLSSGYAINRAGDNAAGLAVSEKMRAQIAGLTQASKNAEDGISMVQTYEGALQETDSILQRMRTIAVQSANGSYQNDVDRDALQLEFDQLNDELNQIADTDFNGVVVLNGGVMADGTIANDTSKVADRPDMQTITITPNAAFTYNSNVNGTVDSGGNGSLSINGVSIKLSRGAGSASMGDSSVGTTTYETSNISVTNGKVNGTISASETYKIDDKTTNIEIHGKNYTISGGQLLNSEGKQETVIDGLLVQVDAGKTVNLSGSYEINDNVVRTGASFSDTTLGVGGVVDADGNGKATINNTVLNLSGGSSEETADVTDSDIKYTASSFALDDDGKVDGTITASGSKEVSDVEKTVKVEFTKMTTNGSGTFGASDNIYSGKVGNQTIYYDATNKKFYDEIVADANSTATAFAGKTAISDIILTTTTSTGTKATSDAAAAIKYEFETPTADAADFANNSVVDATTTEKAINIAGNTYGLNLSGSNWLKDGAVDTTAAGTAEKTVDNMKGVKVSVSGDISGTTTLNNVATNPQEKVGGFKVSSGVSTSDTYNHGTANLTFADNMTLQVGARSKDAVTFNFSYTTNGIGNLKADLNASARGLGTDQVSVKNQEDANAAIDAIDNAINKVSMIRGTFGAIQNRLEHKISNINTNAENLTAAESRIRDTQMDQEMMKFTSAQILSQASQSMLAQANSLPQGVLQLLG